jgi:hypothetical protein
MLTIPVSRLPRKNGDTTVTPENFPGAERSQELHERI